MKSSHGLLEETLALPPSRAAWRTLTEILDTFNEREMAACVDEIERRLVTMNWPDHLRTVPGRWLAKLLDGGDESGLSLTRTLDHVLMPEPVRSARYAWTTTPRLRQLTTVRLHDESFRDDGAISLAESKTLESLTELSIGAHISAEGAATLLSSRRVRGLTTIGLNRNRIGSKGLDALTSSAHPTLRALYVGRNALDDAALDALSKLEAPHLTKLDLDFNAFTTKGLEALARSNLFAPVRELNLSNNNLTEGSCEILASCPKLASLRVLFLHNCALTDECLEVLLASPYLSGTLGNLALSENQLSMRSFRALAECSTLNTLYELDVCHNRVAPQDAEACLRSAPHLRALNRLCV